ncbi:hypothetical protein TNCV_2164351 [Trichonephila clavipes]|nr:hypothetical protein TNCV_2164351 [Trichonephila clavipes]
MVRLHTTPQSAMSIEVTKWQVKATDCEKARGVNSHGYSLQRGMEWQSTIDGTSRDVKIHTPPDTEDPSVSFRTQPYRRIFAV